MLQTCSCGDASNSSLPDGDGEERPEQPWVSGARRRGLRSVRLSPRSPQGHHLEDARVLHPLRDRPPERKEKTRRGGLGARHAPTSLREGGCAEGAVSGLHHAVLETERCAARRRTCELPAELRSGDASEDVRAACRAEEAGQRDGGAAATGVGCEAGSLATPSGLSRLASSCKQSLRAFRAQFRALSSPSHRAARLHLACSPSRRLHLHRLSPSRAAGTRCLCR